jgi:hypothetical protein
VLVIEALKTHAKFVRRQTGWSRIRWGWNYRGDRKFNGLRKLGICAHASPMLFRYQGHLCLALMFSLYFWQVLFEVLAQTLTSWLGWELETTLVQAIYLEWVASAWSGCVSLCLPQASIRPCTVPGTCRLRGSGDLWCSVQMPVLVALCDYPSVYQPSKMRGALQFEQSGHHGCLLWTQKKSVLSIIWDSFRGLAIHPSQLNTRNNTTKPKI